MNAASTADVGWRRRDRRTDLAAAVLFGFAAPMWRMAGGAVTALLLVAGGLLMLIGRDRRLERARGNIWLVEEWSLFALRRVKKRAVQPGQVALTVPERGFLAHRRTVLTVQGESGPIVLEKWRHLPERDYAFVAAAAVARWFGVTLSGVLAPFDGQSKAPARWAELRASQDGISPAADPERFRLWMGSRRAWDLGASAWLSLAGAGLVVLSTFAGRVHGMEAVLLGAALPGGALMATWGLAGVLSWRIATELRPDGLHVERVGLRPDRVLHLPFAAVTWVGQAVPRRPEPALRIGADGAFADLTARKLGLTPAAFADFCETYQRGLAAWLDAKLRERPAAAVTSLPPIPTGPVTLDDRRAAPNSAVTVLAQALPRLSAFGGVGLVVLTYLLARAGADVAQGPATIRFVFPDVIPYLGLNALVTLAAAGVAAAIFAVAAYLLFAGPVTRWHYVLFFPVLVSPVLLAIMGALTGLEAVERWNICTGSAQPPRYRVTVYRKTIQYGPYDYAAPDGPRAGEEAADFWTVTQEPSRLEVRSRLGGIYLVGRRDYDARCEPFRAMWPARLPVSRQKGALD